MILVEVPRGAVNGRNRDFYVSTSYVHGSTQVFLNGIAQRKDWDDGWIEAGSNHILMKRAPLEGDAVQVYFVAL